MLQMIEYSAKQSPEGPCSDYFVNPKTGGFSTKRREQPNVIRDMLTSLAICNNVTPVIE